MDTFDAGHCTETLSEFDHSMDFVPLGCVKCKARLLQGPTCLQCCPKRDLLAVRKARLLQGPTCLQCCPKRDLLAVRKARLLQGPTCLQCCPSETFLQYVKPDFYKGRVAYSVALTVRGRERKRWILPSVPRAKEMDHLRSRLAAAEQQQVSRATVILYDCSININKHYVISLISWCIDVHLLSLLTIHLFFIALCAEAENDKTWQRFCRRPGVLWVGAAEVVGCREMQDESSGSRSQQFFNIVKLLKLLKLKKEVFWLLCYLCSFLSRGI